MFKWSSNVKVEFENSEGHLEFRLEFAESPSALTRLGGCLVFGMRRCVYQSKGIPLHHRLGEKKREKTRKIEKIRENS